MLSKRLVMLRYKITSGKYAVREQMLPEHGQGRLGAVTTRRKIYSGWYTRTGNLIERLKSSGACLRTKKYGFMSEFLLILHSGEWRLYFDPHHNHGPY